jgi:hypothetical protein
MATTTATAPATRNWANILAIVTGLALWGIAIWPGEPTSSAQAQHEQVYPSQVWLAQAISGMCAILAVLLAQRWQRQLLARLLLVVAAAVLLLSLLAFEDFGPRALLTIVLPAMLLGAAAYGIGPIPRET